MLCLGLESRVEGFGLNFSTADTRSSIVGLSIQCTKYPAYSISCSQKCLYREGFRCMNDNPN